MSRKDSEQIKNILKITKERLHYLVYSSPVVMYTCKAGGDFGATFISPNVKRQTGYNPRNFTKNSKFWLSNIHPEDRERVLSGLTKLFEKGKQTHEYRFRFKNGKYYWMRDELNLICDKKGKPIEIVGYWTDITDKKKAEEELKDAQNKWSSLTQNTADFIIITDNKCIVKYINKTLAPDTPETVIGKSIYGFMSKDQNKIAAKSLNKVFKTGKADFYENIAKIPKVGNVWFNTKVVPIKMGKEISGTILISTNITENKKAQEEKEKLQKQLAIYAKKLELKVKKLEKDRIKLTDKEKAVLWGITRYPNYSDLKLTKELKIKRSTVTSIRRRLREKEMYSVINIPHIYVAGDELLTFFYGMLSKNSALDNFLTAYNLQTAKELFGIVVSKNFVEFQKKFNMDRNAANFQTIHFFHELSKLYRFLNYSKWLKNLFKIKIQDKPEGDMPMENIFLNKNEKKVLLKLIEYPELSVYDLSFKLDLSRATIAKIRKKLIDKKAIKTVAVPNIKKLGVGVIALFHGKLISNFKEELIKNMLSKNPNIIFFITGDKEAFVISLFKNYDEYMTSVNKNSFTKIFLEEPTMFKFLTKDIIQDKLDFLAITKRILV